MTRLPAAFFLRPQAEKPAPRKKRPRKGTAFCVVRVIGFEPIRDRSRGILSPLRLPVSPYSQKICCLGQVFGRRAFRAAKARASRRANARTGRTAGRGAAASLASPFTALRRGTPGAACPCRSSVLRACRTPACRCARPPFARPYWYRG